MVKNDLPLIATLRLIRAKGIGALTYNRLLAQADGDPVRALEMAPHIAKKKFTPASEATAKKEIDEALENAITLIPHHDPRYPDALRAIDDAPPVLHVMGQVSALNHPQNIAIVGARNASAHARRFTTNLARELGAKGAMIVSGFALGIDAAAHHGALPTGTIAVLAGGLGKPYPKEHIAMMRDVAANGAIITECPWGEAPTAQHFPRRNRIVSGLSRAVVVVEAALRSGSLITARLAAEQGRDVLAVPGFPGDPRSAGPNALLKDGAGLITNAQDVLEALSTPIGSFIPKTQDTDLFSIPQKAGDIKAEQSGNETDDLILSTLSVQPIAVDDLAFQCQISIQTCQAKVMEMELSGHIIRYPGNRIALAAK